MLAMAWIGKIQQPGITLYVMQLAQELATVRSVDLLKEKFVNETSTFKATKLLNSTLR